MYVDETLKVKIKEIYICRIKVKRGSDIQLENRQVYLESDVNAKGNLGRTLTRMKNGRSLAMLLNISGTTTKLTAVRRIGYATPVRTEFKNSNCKLCTDEVDIGSCSYPNKLNSVESFYTDDGLSSCSNFPSIREKVAPVEESAVPKIEHLKEKRSIPQYEA